MLENSQLAVRFGRRIGGRARPVVVASLASLVVGCASTGLHPADTGDACAAERAELRSSQEYYTQAIVKGAMVGAVIGGLTGWLTGESGKSAAIGAAAGAVAGGVGGYFLAKQQVAKDAAGLSDSVLRDVTTENQEIDRSTVAFARLRDCRFAAAQQAKADYAAGRISRVEAASRLEDQRKRFEEDLIIAEQVGAKMADRAKEYQYASDELLKEDPKAQTYVATERQAAARKPRKRPQAAEPAQVPAGAPPAAAVALATDTNQLKQKAFADDVAVAKSDAGAAFSLEGKVGLLVPVCVPCGAA